MFPRDSRRLAAAAACLVVWCLPAGAQGVKSQLDAVQRDLDRKLSSQATLEETARQAEAEVRSLKLRAVETAQQLNRSAETVGELEERLADLEAEETEKSADMHRRRGELTATLAALQRIARLPAATLIAMPRPPDDTIRSAILLRSAVPTLHREGQRLRDEIENLGRLRATIRDERAALDGALSSLEQERVQLAALTAQKLTILQATRNEERETARAAAELSARAGTLRELVDKLAAPPKVKALLGPDFEPQPESGNDRDRPVAAPLSGSGPVPGGLPAPGRIVTAFGATLPNGLLSRGVSIATRPAAPVVAPQPGRVVFAGNFRGYGNLVILELRNKEHALIAGLGRIHAEIGDEVLAGEPLGEMTPSTAEAPTLYFEIRRRGQPINPVPSSAALNTR